jgi:hypothetical protein
MNERFKSNLGRATFGASIALLLGYFALNGYAFFVAYRDHRIPVQWWDAGGGNHGPWRRYEPVCTLLNTALSLLLLAQPLSLAAIALGYRRAAIVAVAVIIVFFCDLNFFMWLVD